MTAFQRAVTEHYRLHGRHDLPWRRPEADGSFDAYKILVSELMLQQTQVNRVTPKYQEFLMQFPDLPSLAAAELAEVVRAWSGLGYNRRAKYLWQAAQQMCAAYDSTVPSTLEALCGLPGIGRNTAGAIMAYAYNVPVVFVETNIRTAVIFHFFAGQEKVGEAAIQQIIAAALPFNDSRHWYWAVVDYGSSLKRTAGNLNKLSNTYRPQSPFVGSRRQARGEVLRRLAEGPLTLQQLADTVDGKWLEQVISALVAEGLVRHSGSHYRL